MKRRIIKSACSSLVITVLLLIVACNRQVESDFDYDSFPATIKLKGEIVIDSMMSPHSIMCYDSLLLTLERNGRQKMMVYDPATGMEIQSLISTGKGPGEMMQPWNMSSDGDTCWVFDLMLKKALMLHKDPNGPMAVKGAIQLKDRNSTSLLAMGNNQFVGTGFPDSVNLFSFYDREGSVLMHAGEFPDLPGISRGYKADKMYYGTVFKSKSDISLPKKRIAVAYSRLNIIDICDFGGKLIQRIKGPEKVDLKVKRISPQKGMVMYDAQPKYMAYSDVVSGDKEFWVSHSGVILTRDNYLDTRPRRIFCFSWKGDRIRKLEFDIPILSFTVDWENKSLYCLTDNPYPCVYRFSLAGII